jgi:hypothetical protein
VAQKNLKLMVDEDLLDKRTVAALHEVGAAVDVKTMLECNYPLGTKDYILVAATVEKRRILLTANYNDINENKYPPCGHGGIILIDHPRPSPDEVISRLKSFCRSGKRSQAKGHVTYLRADGFTIHKLHREKVEGRYDEKRTAHRAAKRGRRL